MRAQIPWLVSVSVLFLMVIVLLLNLLLRKRNQGELLKELVLKRTAELDTLARNYKGIIWSVDENRIMTTFKGQYTKLLEPYASTMEGMALASAHHDDMHADIIGNVEKTFQSGPQSWTYEINGRVYQSYSTPMYDKNGKVIGVAGSTDDITEMVRIQKELLMEKSVLETIFYTTPELIACKDTEHKYIKINKKYEEFFDVREADIIGTDQSGRGVTDEMRKKFWESDRRVIDENRTLTVEEQFQGIDGTPAFLEIIKAPIIKDGEVLGVIGLGRDMTKRKMMEDAYKQRVRMSAALNEMSVIFLAQNEESFEARMTAGVKVLVDIMELDRLSVWRNIITLDGLNTSQIYRWDKESGGTTPPLPQFQDVLFSKLAPNWEAHMTGEVVISGPVKQMEKAPVILQDIGTVSAIFMPLIINNAFWGFVVFEDLHNERYFESDTVEIMRTAAFLCANTIMRTELDRDIKAAMEAATSANRAKSEFLSRMSHEIRTPLNAIMGMIRIGSDTNDIQKKDYCIDRAGSASKHLLGIINDILDMSKIEANKFELSYEDFDFEKMLMNVVSVVDIRAEEKQQDLVINIDKGVPRCITCDQMRLSQVITNLLSNAIKFTPEYGTVKLNIEKTDELGDEVILKIEVVDNGIGISGEQQKRLFAPFGQANAGIAQRFGGTGLGLAISKRIVELMGGMIWIESELGKGAKFIFTIRAQKVTSKQKKAISKGSPEEIEEEISDLQDERIASRFNFSGYTVLIAEDVEINREIMSALLDETGITVDYAENGEIAVSMFKENPDKYSLILMDIQMPKMDGYEATRAIRAMDLAHAKEVPIVAMTANVFREDIEKCLAVGMTKHLGKPLDIADILKVLHEYLS